MRPHDPPSFEVLDESNDIPKTLASRGICGEERFPARRDRRALPGNRCAGQGCQTVTEAPRCNSTIRSAMPRRCISRLKSAIHGYRQPERKSSAGRQPGSAQVQHAYVDRVESRRNLFEFLDEQGVAGDVEPTPR